MSKTLKRTLAIVMAIAMIFSLSATAFAYNDQYSVTAYVRLQTATAPDDWAEYDFEYSYLEDVSFITPYSPNTGYFVPVTVTQSTPITVKDIIEALSGVTLISCSYHDSYGCIHEDDYCNCATCNCTWKKVEDYYNPGTYHPAMNSLCYNNNIRTNNSYIEDYGNGHGYYEGTSWEYFVSNNATTGDYPQTMYMDQYIVSSSLYITLSFDTSSFEW